MTNPLISVIVPVYKVEPYLRKCVDSITAQTYTNLEIILIDDGSPDNCGKICDEYAERDERVRVVHKENGGQSTARNAGLEIARGDYIGFVDSDDYIELNMFENLAEQTIDAEIVICGIYYDYDNKKPKKEVLFSKQASLTKEQALALFFSGQIKGHSFNKLFARKLFENVRFPIGQIYEDIPVVRQCLLKANKVVYVANILYHYVQHCESSVFKSEFKEFLHIFDELNTQFEISRTIFGGKFNSQINGNKLSLAFWVLSMLSKQNNVQKDETKAIIEIIKGNIKYLGYANLSKKAKLFCICIYIANINTIISLFKFFNKVKTKI